MRLEPLERQIAEGGGPDRDRSGPAPVDRGRPDRKLAERLRHGRKILPGIARVTRGGRKRRHPRRRPIQQVIATREHQVLLRDIGGEQRERGRNRDGVGRHIGLTGDGGAEQHQGRFRNEDRLLRIGSKHAGHGPHQAAVADHRVLNDRIDYQPAALSNPDLTDERDAMRGERPVSEHEIARGVTSAVLVIEQAVIVLQVAGHADLGACTGQGHERFDQTGPADR